MFFIDSSDIKFGTFLNYVFHNVINEIGSKKFQQNCGQLFPDEGKGVPSKASIHVENVANVSHSGGAQGANVEIGHVHPIVEI